MSTSRFCTNITDQLSQYQMHNIYTHHNLIIDMHSNVTNMGFEKFESKVNDFLFEMIMSDACVILKMTSLDYFTEFNAVIDQQRLSSNSLHSQLIKTPEQLFKLLSFLIPQDKVRITNDGEIKFDLNYSVGPINHVANIIFKTERKSFTKDQIFDRKFIKIQNDLVETKKSSTDYVKQELNQIRSEFQIMMKILLQNQIELSKMKEMNQAQNQKHELEMKQLQMQHQIEIKAIKEEMRVKEVEMNLSLQNLKSQILKSVEKFHSQSFMQVPSKIQTLSDSFQINQNDLAFKSFQLTKIRVKKVENNNKWQYIIGKRIPINSVSSYRVKQIKVAENDIMYGIRTDQILNLEHEWQTDAFLGYYAYGAGYLIKQATRRDKGSGGINNKDVVQVKTDTINWKITWFKNGLKLKESQIPQKMRKRQLYEAIMMVSVNDEIELL